MTDEQIALACRAVACKHWRWMPGMRWTWRRLPRMDDTSDRKTESHHHVPPDALPDLTDPATLGCLLTLVREAWKNSEACVIYVDGDPLPWSITPDYWELRTEFTANTEPEALVAALEAAP